MRAEDTQAKTVVTCKKNKEFCKALIPDKTEKQEAVVRVTSGPGQGGNEAIKKLFIYKGRDDT